MAKTNPRLEAPYLLHPAITLRRAVILLLLAAGIFAVCSYDNACTVEKYAAGIVIVGGVITLTFKLFRWIANRNTSTNY